MFGKIARFIRVGEPAAAQQHPLLAQVIATVGGNIEEARDFTKLVIPAIEGMLAYLDRQIAALPGPAAVSEQLFGTDPVVSTLFPEADEIGRAFGRSLAVKETLPELARGGHDEIHALLGMRCKPANGAVAGFADHVLHSLAPSDSDAREALRQAAFDRLLRNFTEHVEKLRRKERLLKLEWEWNLRHDVAKTIETADEPEFVYAAQELTPDNLLRGLIAWLNTPERFFRLEGSGISMPGAPAAASSEPPASLPMLHCSDRRQWLVCLIRFSAADALQALQRETHTHRYIFI